MDNPGLIMDSVAPSARIYEVETLSHTTMFRAMITIITLKKGRSKVVRIETTKACRIKNQSTISKIEGQHRPTLRLPQQ